jgi:hypothetical protein
MDELQRRMIEVSLRNMVFFTREISGIKLRKYQKAVAEAVVESVINKRGLTIVVMFPRQSGKNELQAHIESYLLTLHNLLDKEIVKVSPTWKPQCQNAMRRLERVLKNNIATRDRWVKEQGYIYRVGEAKILFLSGSRYSNVVGATASLLLQCDEAQDVDAAKWDKDFGPMAASTNATRVFWGTAWTSRTLLARELRAAMKAQKKDGLRRVFHISADEVSKEVPAYAKYVAEQVAKLGRNHPLVKTQYYSQEITAEGGMFPPERRRLMRGDHSRLVEPEVGVIYAFLIDVAGEDEAAATLLTDLDKGILRNPARDSTSLTIMEVDLSTLEDPLLKAPTYLVRDRRNWIGTPHTTLYAEIKALADFWRPRYLVVDATGVGAGLCSFLSRALPGRVLPYTFTPKSKSDLGWNFLAVCDTGRFKDHQAAQGSPEYAEFWHQLEYVEYEALENKMLRWSVPDGTRDAATGELVHDDLVLSAALSAVLDEQEWSIGGPTLIVRARDPLEGMDRNY